MAMIKITPFAGMIPRTGARLLPDSGAQSADNVKIQSGELRPLHEPALAYTPASPKTNPALSIFKARSGSELSVWFSWPVDVDCVRVPLATDVESRFCWTSDGPPKFATYTSALTGGGNDYPDSASELMLGIPVPTTAVSVSASGGVGAAVTRFYRYTFFSQDGEESGPSPVSVVVTGKVDDTWAIGSTTAMQGFPANTGTGTASYSAPSTTFTNAASALHWLRVGDLVVLDGDTLTVTAVPTTSSFKVTGDYSAETTWARKTYWNTTDMTRRIYRTSGTAGTYQLVVADLTATSYNDTILDADIPGDELISENWIPPPIGLTGMCVHSSGALCGFVSNLLCFSEPLQPHAWPEAYQLSSGYNGVGVAAFGSSVVMATLGPPFVATGVEPVSMTGEDISGMYPCLAKRSVISVGDAVLYASKHGLVRVGPGGIGIFTDGFYTRDEWELLNPETMVCETANGCVYTMYTNDVDVNEILIFDGQIHTRASVNVSELYADPSSGDLFVTTSEGILLWDSTNEVPLQGNWLSKVFVLPSPVNMGAGKVEFDLAITEADRIAMLAAAEAAALFNAALVTLPITTVNALALGGGYNTTAVNWAEVLGSAFVVPPGVPASNVVSITLYSRGEVIVSKQIFSDDVFRLPSGYRKDSFSIGINSQCTIKEIRIAETPNELRQA
jgi:hypothetical protein